MAKATIRIDDKLLKKIQKNVAGRPVDSWVIHDGVEYGVFQEFGRAPGKPPPADELKDWAKAVLGDENLAFVVARAIGRNGMAARPALVPAFEEHTKRFASLIGTAIEAGIDLNDILEKVANDIKAQWQQNVRVDTSAYKNSIEAEKQ